MAQHAGVLGERSGRLAQLGCDHDVEGAGEERQPLTTAADVLDVLVAARGDIVPRDDDLVSLLGQLVGERRVAEVQHAGQAVPDQPLGGAISGESFIFCRLPAGTRGDGYASGVSDPFVEAAQLEGVPSAFAASRDGIDAVLRDRGLRRTTPEDTARSLLLGAAATASLEGCEVTVDEMAAGGGDATARAAVRLSTELLGLLHTWTASPVQAVARIHALAAGGSVDDADLGRPVNAAEPLGWPRWPSCTAGRPRRPRWWWPP